MEIQIQNNGVTNEITEEARNYKLTVRLTQEERLKFINLANGKPLSTWIREQVLLKNNML